MQIIRCCFEYCKILQFLSELGKKKRNKTKSFYIFAAALKYNGPVAQLDRVSHYECDGCRFESCRGHPSGELVIFNRFSVFCFSQFPCYIWDTGEKGIYYRGSKFPFDLS